MPKSQSQTKTGQSRVVPLLKLRSTSAKTSLARHFTTLRRARKRSLAEKELRVVRLRLLKASWLRVEVKVENRQFCCLYALLWPTRYQCLINSYEGAWYSKAEKISTQLARPVKRLRSISETLSMRPGDQKTQLRMLLSLQLTVRQCTPLFQVPNHGE